MSGEQEHTEFLLGCSGFPSKADILHLRCSLEVRSLSKVALQIQFNVQLFKHPVSED